MNETMKALQDLNTSKDEFKQYGEAIPIGFELDPKITSIHVSRVDEIDHVSKKYPHGVKDQVEGTIVRALNDLHVSNININFALVQEVDVKTNQTFSAFYLPVQ